MKDRGENLLVIATSIWSWAGLQAKIAALGAGLKLAGLAMVAYGPGVLTIIYIIIKIYFKLKHERQRRAALSGRGYIKARP